MPLYQLRPLSVCFDDPDWRGSRHRLPCQVVAGSERRAREHAARLFSAPPPVRHPDDLAQTEGRPTAPAWLQARLVEATLAGDGAGMEEGTVLMPGRPGAPHGYYKHAA